MNEIKHQLFERLKAIGIVSESVEGIKRDVANCLRTDAAMSLSEVNRRLNYLGWEDSQLDYHTFQLLVAWIENPGGLGHAAQEDPPVSPSSPISEALA